MSYQVSWIIPNHVLHISYVDDIQLSDLQESSQQIADYLSEAYVEAPKSSVTGIVDMREAKLTSLLRSILSIMVKQIADVIDPRIWKAKPGFVVLITGSEHAKTMVSLVIKLSSQPLTTVASMDEALTVIGSMYPELQSQLDTYKEKHPSTS